MNAVPTGLLLVLALVVAGCVSPIDALDAASLHAAAQPETLVMPLALEGETPLFVAGCAWGVVVSACTVQPLAGQWNNRLDLDAAGVVESLHVTLTWEATSPATQALGIELFSSRDGRSESEHVIGGSPLTFHVEGPHLLREGWTHSLYVFVPWEGAYVDVAEAFGAAGTRQPFALEGSLTLTPFGQGEPA